ncbi:MAG: DUF2294 domain-containing protein [Bacillota bacterium]
MKVTKGQMEAEISKLIIQFEKDHMGRGPSDTKTIILDDLILVRLKNVLTPAEQELSKTAQGRSLIKQVRIQLFENSRPLLEKLIKTVTKTNLISIHSDISTVTGERIIVFVVEEPLIFN